MTTINPFKPAVRTMAKARLGITGPAGAGKTFTALRLAHQLGARIAVADAERGSAALYVGEEADGLRFAYDIAPINDTSPRGYIAAIRAAEAAGYEVLILDGITPEWDWCKEEVDRVKVRFSGNAWSAWSVVTPKHREFVDAMLTVRLHLIATIRTKTAWETTKDEGGKSKPQKIGTSPETRENMDYEFSIVLNMQPGAYAHVGKTRCRALTDTSWREPGADLARVIREWLTSDTGGAGDPTVSARERPPALVVAGATSAPPVPFPVATAAVVAAPAPRAPTAAPAPPADVPARARALRFPVGDQRSPRWAAAIGKAFSIASVADRRAFAIDMNLPPPGDCTVDDYERVRAELASRGLLALDVDHPEAPAVVFAPPPPPPPPVAAEAQALTTDEEGDPFGGDEEEPAVATITPEPWTAADMAIVTAAPEARFLLPGLTADWPGTALPSGLLGVLDGLSGTRLRTDSAGVLGRPVLTRLDAVRVLEALAKPLPVAPPTSEAEARRARVVAAGQTCGIPAGAVTRLLGEAGKGGLAPRTTWDRIRASGSLRAESGSLGEACRAAGIATTNDAPPAAAAVEVLLALSASVARRRNAEKEVAR